MSTPTYESVARSLTALSCMRRSGETKTTLAKRDTEIARLEAMLATMKQAEVDAAMDVDDHLPDADER